MHDVGVAAVDAADARAHIVRVCQHEVGTVRRPRVPGAQPMQHVAEEDALRAEADAGPARGRRTARPRRSGPGCARNTVRLVGPGDHAARKGRRRRDDGVVAGDVELLDQERAERRTASGSSSDHRQPVGRRSVERRRRGNTRSFTSAGRKSNRVKTSASGNCGRAARAPARRRETSGTSRARSRRARRRQREGAVGAGSCRDASELRRACMSQRVPPAIAVEDADARQAPNVRGRRAAHKLADGLVRTCAGLGPNPSRRSATSKGAGARARHPRKCRLPSGPCRALGRSGWGVSVSARMCDQSTPTRA